MDEKALQKPLSWKKPRRVFVNSMGDLFHKGVPFKWVDQVMHTVHHCPQHTFIVLTKRAERMRAYFERYVKLYGSVAANLWLGVSVEDQMSADERIPLLRKTPAAKIFVSMEPLLGPVNLRLECEGCGAISDAECPGSHSNCRGIRPLDWIICGPENGSGKRPFDEQWAIVLQKQAQAVSVPFFYKGGLLNGKSYIEIP